MTQTEIEMALYLAWQWKGLEIFHNYIVLRGIDKHMNLKLLQYYFMKYNHSETAHKNFKMNEFLINFTFTMLCASENAFSKNSIIHSQPNSSLLIIMQSNSSCQS